MDLKHLDVDLEIKQISDTGEFAGYASTSGNVDRGGDIVEVGAFKVSLDQYAQKGKLPKMLWNHDPNKVVGVWMDMQEDEKGLFVKGRMIVDTQLGKETHVLMQQGAIDSMSIGYKTIEADFEGENASVRRLKQLELWEVSLVTFPMNPEAAITAVKRLDHIGDVERILREAGVANKFAKLVALYGYEGAIKRLDGQREADALAKTQDDNDLRRLFANLKARKGISHV
jgi:HK97 family phage prohead protease